MLNLLNLHTLENKPKPVFVVPSFENTLVRTKEIGADIVFVKKCIESGTPLPGRFYRKYRETKDAALELWGLMHLHVGTDRKDLLFLHQFDSAVLFVALTDHSPFKQRPVAAGLQATHQKSVAAWVSNYEESLKQAAQNRAVAVKQGLSGGKARSQSSEKKGKKPSDD